VAASALFAGALVSMLGGCGNGGGNGLDPSLVFVRRVGGDMEIWLMNTDGSDKRKLVDNGDNNALQASLSPDGRSLLYLTNDPSLTRMIVQDLRTGATDIVRETTINNDDMTPAFSPDGRQIAYSDNGNDIHVMDADGTNVVDLTSDQDDELSPAWDASGSTILFNRGWEPGNIWKMNSDGSGQTLVKAANATYGYSQPQFMPDGRIVCMRLVIATDHKDIVIMNEDGSGEVNLTPGTDDDDEFFPTVSEDGSTIFFSTDRNGEKDVYVGTLSGDSLTDSRNLTGETDDDCFRASVGNLDRGYTGL